MSTSYRVTSSTGQLLGVFPQGSLLSVKSLVEANPGAQVKTVTSISNPCANHPAFEADNCPTCGTSRMA